VFSLTKLISCLRFSSFFNANVFNFVFLMLVVEIVCRRNIISDFFSLQLKLGVDESYTLQISTANESSVFGDATIEVCYV
jgi:hypothetical protein